MTIPSDEDYARFLEVHDFVYCGEDENCAHVTYMPADEFDELLRTIDTPDDVSGFLDAFRGLRG